MYNRYVQNYGGQHKNTQPKTLPKEQDSGDFTQKENVHIPPPIAPKEPLHKPLKENSPLRLPSLSGIKGMLQGFLGDKMDISDLLLILILLLIYLEKEDEEILITLSALIVMGFN